MKAMLFALSLFCLCVVVSSSSAQHETATPAPTMSVEVPVATTDTPPHISPLLIGIARATKYLYTRDAAFDYEKRKQKDSLNHEHP